MLATATARLEQPNEHYALTRKAFGEPSCETGIYSGLAYRSYSSVPLHFLWGGGFAFLCFARSLPSLL